MVLGAALAAAAALLIAIPLSRTFTAPFVKMSEAARAIAAGNYGGRIGVEDNPGGGSTFVVSLPMEQPEERSPNATHQSSTERPSWAEIST